MRTTSAEVRTGLAASPQLAPAGTINGVAIDRLGCYSAVFTVVTGAIAGAPTSQSVNAKLQHSDTSGGVYTDISGATLSTITAGNASGEINVDLSSAKRYVRVVLTVAFVGGTTPTIGVSATYCLGEADAKNI